MFTSLLKDMIKKKTTKKKQMNSQRGCPWWLHGKESTCNEGDASSIPGLGRFPREGNSNPPQYS